jgi:chaperonin GroES
MEAEVSRKLSPLADRVMIKPLDKEQVTKGGLVIPDTAKERPQEGEVVAVGVGRITDDGKKVAMELKVGDKIVYSRYAGNEWKEDDIEYLILKESEILAKISA